MNTGLIDGLFMLLFNTAICICLPKVLASLGSNRKPQSITFSSEEGDRLPLRVEAELSR